MDTIRNVINVMERAQEPIRPYLKKVANFEIFTPDYARYKMTVYYKGGKRASYHSLDTVTKDNGATVRDEYESLMKLVRLAEQKIKSSQFIKSIVIYCTEGKTPETKTADYSILVYKRTYLTTYSNQNICFNSRNELFFKS